MAIEYQEAMRISLCPNCANRVGCFKPDTERKEGWSFKPTTFCSQFKEASQ